MISHVSAHNSLKEGCIECIQPLSHATMRRILLVCLVREVGFDVVSRVHEDWPLFFEACQNPADCHPARMPELYDVWGSSFQQGP